MNEFFETLKLLILRVMDEKLSGSIQIHFQNGVPLSVKQDTSVKLADLKLRK